ncbi:MAG: hypothetical protein ABII18_04240 [bacterium]
MVTINNGQTIPQNFRSILNLPEVIADIEQNGSCHDIGEGGVLQSPGDFTANEAVCTFDYFKSTPGLTRSDLRAVRQHSGVGSLLTLSDQKLKELASYMSSVFPEVLPIKDEVVSQQKPISQAKKEGITREEPIGEPLVQIARDEESPILGLISEFEIKMDQEEELLFSQDFEDELCLVGVEAEEIGINPSTAMFKHIQKLMQIAPDALPDLFHEGAIFVLPACEE